MKPEELISFFGRDVLSDPSATDEERASAVMGGEEGARRRKELADQHDDTRSWIAPGNGYRLSDRVWAVGQAERDGIEQVLKRGVAGAWGPQETATALRSFALDPHSGGYFLRRLARTEISRAFNLGALQAAEANPFVDLMRWRRSSSSKDVDQCTDNATRDVGYGPGVYPVAQFPRIPNHPNCMCVAVPVPRDTDQVVAELRRAYGLDGGAGSF